MNKLYMKEVEMQELNGHFADFLTGVAIVIALT